MSTFVTLQGDSAELITRLDSSIKFEKPHCVALVSLAYPIHYMIILGTVTVEYNSRVVSRDIKIVDRCPPSILAKTIENAFRELGVVKCDYIPALRQLHLYSTNKTPKNDVEHIRVSFDDRFLKFLGFVENKVLRDGFKANLHFDVASIKNLYIHCDCAEPQYISDSLRDIIGTISPHGEAFTYKYLHIQSPHFIRVNKTHIDEIKVRITDSNDNLIQFVRGPIVVKLQFINDYNSPNQRRVVQGRTDKHSVKLRKHTPKTARLRQFP